MNMLPIVFWLFWLRKARHTLLETDAWPSFSKQALPGLSGPSANYRLLQ